MGIDLMLYRCRIGLFRGGLCRMHPHKKTHQEQYSRMTKSSDIYVRVFCCCIVLLLMLLQYRAAIAIRDEYLFNDVSRMNGVDFCSTAHGMACNLEPLRCWRFGTYIAHTYEGTYSEATLYEYFVQRLLMLAADVELNPGPSSDTQEILEAISLSNVKTMQLINDVKTEVLSVKSEISSMKSDLSSMQEKIKQVEGTQVVFEKRLSDIDVKLDRVEYLNEVANDDIVALDTKFEKHCQKCEDLENIVDRLESEHRKCNMRVFGLDECPDENPDSLLLSVSENVCKIARPNEDAKIIFAKRLGERVDDKPRMVLVKFRDADYKFRLFTGRDLLREHGIRVSNDLTHRQRSMLREFKAQGKMGYFKGGRLCEFTDNNTPTGEIKSTKSRVFRKTVRSSGLQAKSGKVAGCDRERVSIVDLAEHQEPIDVDA